MDSHQHVIQVDYENNELSSIHYDLTETTESNCSESKPKPDDSELSDCDSRSEISDNPEISIPYNANIQVLQGLGRDVPWAIVSFLNTNFSSEILGPIWGPWLTQQTIGAAGLIAANIVTRCCSAEYETKEAKSVLNTYSAASGLSIIPWNVAQDYGFNQGVSKDMTSQNAGYYAGIYTGLFEGLVQSVIMTASFALLDPAEKAKWELKWQFLAKKLLEIGCSIPGGAAWQIIFNATAGYAATGTFPLIFSSVAVAGGAAVTSKTCSLLYSSLENSIDSLSISSNHLNNRILDSDPPSSPTNPLGFFSSRFNTQKACTRLQENEAAENMHVRYEIP